MEQRRRDIDTYVEGEHRWLGDTDVGVQVTYNAHVTPWYCREEDIVLK